MILWAIARAPVQLDQKTEEWRNAAEAETERIKGEARHTAELSARKISDLENSLKQKHPHDIHLERAIAKGLSRIEIPEKIFVTELLDTGRMTYGQVQQRIRNADQLMEKMGVQLFRYHPNTPGSGIVDIGGEYEINPTMIYALRNVLYPTPPE